MGADSTALTASDIARVMGWNRMRACRWLSRMRKRHGESVVYDKNARGYVIGRRDFELLIVRERASLTERIAAVEERQREQDQRIDTLAREVSTLRRAS